MNAGIAGVFRGKQARLSWQVLLAFLVTSAGCTDPPEGDDDADSSTPQASGPSLELEDTEIDFGSVLLGQSGSHLLQISNGGSSDLMLEAALEDDGGGQFFLIGEQVFVVAPEASVVLELQFAPSWSGVQTGSLQLQSNDEDNPQMILSLEGQGEEDDADKDGFSVEEDCDDGDSSIYPGAEEVCDAIDNNCDGSVDEGTTQTYYPDGDQDGFGDETSAAEGCVAGEGEVSVGGDCDDAAAAVNPDGVELCNGVDDDCNGLIDDDASDPTDWYGDQDGDGVGVDTEVLQSCDRPEGYAQVAGDCDDESADVAPGQEERCDGLDNDCDGSIDDGASDVQIWYVDADGDGVGTDEQSVEACVAPEGHVAEAGDCDDTDPAYHPGAPENDCADPNDYNCDGAVGYSDVDGDGFAACNDCDDANPAAHDPEATELCDQADNNCDGEVDEGATTEYWLDEDGDGFGGNTSSMSACVLPDGYAVLPDDCDDGASNIHPGADEICDQLDNDCDGSVDEDAVDVETWYVDQDGDGFGVEDGSQTGCTPEAGYVAQAGDCDDSDPRFNPEAEETDCTDANDYNCDGSVGYVDEDGDGYAACEDCDDGNEAIHPEGAESCNAQDDDCDGVVDEAESEGCTVVYEDGDGDTWGTDSSACLCNLELGYATRSGDCDDSDSKVSPDTTESCNGIDDDCDQLVDEVDASGCERAYADLDEDGWGNVSDYACVCSMGDGYTAAVSGDCDDGDDEKYPGNLETCDGKDNNCSGEIDEGVKTTFYLDNDGDGFGASYNSKEACEAPFGYVEAGGDCNDYNIAIHPSADEVCDGIDNNCNGVEDEDLPEVTVYVDLDGDGHGASSTAGSGTCLTDEDGDGQGETAPDGYALVADDCDDSDATVYTGALESCDGKDNDCDGLTDSLCFESCGGSWPYRMDYTYGTPRAYPADLNGDGDLEVLVQDSFGFAITNKNGEPLYHYSAATHNYSRGQVLLGDIDDYDQFGADVQTVEVLTGNGSRPRFYRLNADDTVTVLEDTSRQVYDASRFLASDVDFDGQPEFFTTDWYGGDPGILGFRFDRSDDTITLLGVVHDPDGAPVYTNGRALADLDGDGEAEFVYSNGYAHQQYPQYWMGNIYVFDFLDVDTMSMDFHCDPTSCFPTALDDLYEGAVSALYVYDDWIQTAVTYFYTNEVDTANPAVSYQWGYDFGGSTLEGYPNVDGLTYLTDINDDGLTESSSVMVTYGLWDVNADGYPDYLYSSGSELHLQLWSESRGAFEEHDPSTLSISGESVRVRGVWDMDTDGRLDVISADANGNVYCHSLGSGTWNKLSSLPPHNPLYLRTNQWDNYEPNDGADLDGDGLPDRVVPVASAMSRQGAFYSYLSTENDQDFFRLDTGYGASICLQSPPERAYRLTVYSYLDRWDNNSHASGSDGLPDGEVWSDASSAGGSICFYSSRVAPSRTGEYKFVVGISSEIGFSPYWPYWLEAAK